MTQEIRISRLEELTSDRLEALLGLELEILPVLQASGIEVTAEQVRAAILSDPEQLVVLLPSEGAPLGALRFSRVEGGIFVKSLQLAESAPRRTLVSLLRAALEALSAEEGGMSGRITSVVQAANPRSLALHERLGFSREKVGTKAIRFGIDARGLREELERRLIGTRGSRVRKPGSPS